MDLETLEKEALNDLEASHSLKDIETVAAAYLGRKDGRLTRILRSLGDMPPEEKKRIGQGANKLKILLEEKISTRKKELSGAELQSKLSSDQIDATLPGLPFQMGHSHPILKAIEDISHIFHQLGFEVVEGPEIESDKNNFTDLNIPENHPSRDMHDTFYLNALDKGGNKLLLRTHTSPVQIRLMKKTKPPVRILAPGRVYRHEAVDATHAAIFHQVEGLAVDKNISFADLKGTLEFFARKYFGSDARVRFRPSYFPFVEPGAEMDLWFRGRWMEIMGAGMVHPQVLRNVGYDPTIYRGFAFGMGVERIVMGRYQIEDIRSFLESDLRFLEQFA